MPVASSMRRGDGGGGAELHERVDELGVGADDRPGVVLRSRLRLGGVLGRVADRQHDVLAEPQRGEPGLVGRGGQLEELAGGDVVGGEADLHGGSCSGDDAARRAGRRWRRRRGPGRGARRRCRRRTSGALPSDGRPRRRTGPAPATSTILAVAVVLDALHVAVGLGLRVVLDLAGGEQHVPLAVLLGEQLLPLGEGRLGEQLVEQRDQRLGVLAPAVERVGEPLVGEPVELVDERRRTPASSGRTGGRPGR